MAKDTDYIYSAVRAKTMETHLFSPNQLERMIAAPTYKELFAVLQDTFLAPYLAQHEATDVSYVLNQPLIEAKKVLDATTPDKSLLAVLWLRYDFLNLKVIIKGKLRGLSDADILGNCIPCGIFDPQHILTAYDEERVHTLLTEFEPVLEVAKSDLTHRIYAIDIAANRAYLAAITKIADKAKSPFVKELVRILIDLYNLKSAIRALRIDGIEPEEFVAAGGSIPTDAFQDITMETALELFAKFSQKDFWMHGIEQFKQTDNYSIIERIADDYISMYLKQFGYDIFSVAPLFAYFLKVRNHLQIARTIIVAKKNNLPEAELRQLLRQLYI